MNFLNFFDAEPLLEEDSLEPVPFTTRAIEDESFPFEDISDVAEMESWRKEVYRPIYHVHKWWARRLGSVFRAIILGCALPPDCSLMQAFYRPMDLRGLVVFDPFMGSGTTVGEAHKLGCCAVGRDINPVAAEAVRTALGLLDRRAIERTYQALEVGVSRELKGLYACEDADGRPAEALYFFWVMTLPCPACGDAVDLFSSQTFSRHAYAAREPRTQVVCPDCGEVFAAQHGDERVICPGCAGNFDPRQGAAQGTKATCRHCRHVFPIATTVKRQGRPPKHRPYAKLVLDAQGQKRYLRVTSKDLAVFDAAVARLAREEGTLPLPILGIEPGHNTNQVLNYGYRQWREFFNARQLLALGLLAHAIGQIEAEPTRRAFWQLFSSTLEFNNMFASYKGEGTGAVRHMFAHHILKPERMSVEANVWGTPKSSGAFSTLFHSRLLRALDYRERPFEVSSRPAKGTKVFLPGVIIGGRVAEDWPPRELTGRTLHLSCGPSQKVGLPDKSVDVVVTDPPFFDNVHYSELADFFQAWRQPFSVSGQNCHSPAAPPRSTRVPEEVQDRDEQRFADKLAAVLSECWRVLKDDGLLVFTYHHSRPEGWTALARAVRGAGFAFVQAHPVKAEMSGAAPKSQAKDPIDLDIIMVCRRHVGHDAAGSETATAQETLQTASEVARRQVARMRARGRRLSRNDVWVIVASQGLTHLSARHSSDQLAAEFEAAAPALRALSDHLHEQSPATVCREEKNGHIAGLSSQKAAPTDEQATGGEREASSHPAEKPEGTEAMGTAA